MFPGLALLFSLSIAVAQDDPADPAADPAPAEEVLGDVPAEPAPESSDPASESKPQFGLTAEMQAYRLEDYDRGRKLAEAGTLVGLVSSGLVVGSTAAMIVGINVGDPGAILAGLGGFAIGGIGLYVGAPLLNAGVGTSARAARDLGLDVELGSTVGWIGYGGGFLFAPLLAVSYIAGGVKMAYLHRLMDERSLALRFQPMVGQGRNGLALVGTW